MERSVIFLQSLLVLLLAKHVTSSTSNCTCEFPKDFCKPNITAVQGKVLGSQLADENGSLPSEDSGAHKTRYNINMTQILINGSQELKLTNNTFKIPVRLTHPCHNHTEVGKTYLFVGNVNDQGKWSKLDCELVITSRSSGEDSGGFSDVLGEEEGSGGGSGEGLGGFLNLFGEEETFRTMCETNKNK